MPGPEKNQPVPGRGKTQKVEITNLNQNSSAPKEEFSFDLQHEIQDFKTSENKVPPTQPSNLRPNIKKSGHFFRRVWYIFEWLAVSAAIFAILFLIINFQSYSELFKSKFNQLTGQTQNQMQVSSVKNAAPENQQPLPIVQNPDSAKKQVPDLNLAVTPVDYRVVIPRIGKNVPIVNIPVDKLLQKDFAGLEKQIQDALQNGVLHFPGTAQPGEGGNVVITGHSSYFPWDP